VSAVVRQVLTFPHRATTRGLPGIPCRDDQRVLHKRWGTVFQFGV